MFNAQPGHEKHQREPFGPAEIDLRVDHRLGHCPDCGGELELLDGLARVVQQVELVAKPVSVVEHCCQGCRCGKCRKEIGASIRERVRQAGLIDPPLTDLVAYLKGTCYCRFSVVRDFLREVCGVAISCGQRRKVACVVRRSSTTKRIACPRLPRSCPRRSPPTSRMTLTARRRKRLPCQRRPFPVFGF